jgi:hypothetical protein
MSLFVGAIQTFIKLSFENILSKFGIEIPENIVDNIKDVSTLYLSSA